MNQQVNTRELILGILLEVNKEGQYSHLVIRSTLEKYQYLEKQERAFILPESAREHWNISCVWTIF